MATQITANLPTLNFPREVDYPTQEDWAAFSAAAELNFGILGSGWSTQMQLWKTQANAMSIELNNNADLAQSIANYQGGWTSKGYTLGQTVSVSGVYYICKLTHSTGQNPTDVSSLYWNLALGNWSLKADIKSTNITVNVGAGQTYTTINQALEYLSGFYPMYKKSGVTATINLKAGFVMAEQVLVSGIDLGWITIVGEDAETIITHTALTTTFNDSYPAFGVDKCGTSPVIGQLFRFNVEKVGENKHGLMAYGAGSSANVLSGKGFIGAGASGIYAGGNSTVNARDANCSYSGGDGIVANDGSTVNARGANCSNAGNAGIYAVRGSTINAQDANCSNAGNYGIYANAGSTINAQDANCSYSGGDGIVANDGSTVNARGANCSNAGNAGILVENASTANANSANCSNAGAYGIYAGNTSTIDANSANCSNAGSIGIWATRGATTNATVADCSNAGSIGIYADLNSTINAYQALIKNQTAGAYRVRVTYGSHIGVDSINTTGGTVPVLSQTANTLTSNGIIYQ